MGIRGRVLEVGGSGSVSMCRWPFLLVWGLGLRRSDWRSLLMMAMIR